MAEREPVSIGDLVVLLRNCDPDAEVIYDFPPYQYPTCIDSYRGYYDMPAIGYRNEGDAPTVSDLISELEKASSGEVYHGWKGGEYTYGEDDWLWVANPGETSPCTITGLVDNGGEVILRTAYTKY